MNNIDTEKTRTKIEFAMERVFPECGEPKDWSRDLAVILPEYGIFTDERVAAFLAQCGHESAGFSVLSENLNYSEDALRSVFGKYFRDKDPKDYARNPEKIANLVYANRMGNGPGWSGDGWRYRGRGLIQLTGKRNYENFSRDFGVDAVDNPEVVSKDKKVAVKSAVWFWDAGRLNDYADRMDLEGMTRAINGGYNGLNHRVELFEKCLSELQGIDLEFSPGTEDLETLRIGDRGLGVEMVQKALGILADGIFGPGTERAVKKWQGRHGLVVDGVVGQNTMLDLFS